MDNFFKAVDWLAKKADTMNMATGVIVGLGVGLIVCTIIYLFIF